MMRRQSGFTYLGVLITVAMISLIATATLQVGSIAQRRVAEEELLAIGTEFRAALLSYAESTPAGHLRSPKSLEDLLKDKRFSQTRRHLRKIYVDPLTGKAEWGLVMAPDGSGIIGIYSLSEDKPIKIGNFEPLYQSFSDKPSYRYWVFKP
jgi:type II secretory pathway pseudopilin PulG